jgi:hypothetical protein
MLPLSYLELPPRLWLPDEFFDAIYHSSSLLRDSRPATSIDNCTKILLRSDAEVTHKLMAYILLAVAHEEPENVSVRFT